MNISYSNAVYKQKTNLKYHKKQKCTEHLPYL